MSTEVNKRQIRQYFDALNQDDLEEWTHIFSPDVVCWIGGLAEPVRGLATNVQMYEAMKSAFSDIHFELLDIVAEQDKVAVRRAYSMKHTGVFEGIPPTGREITGTALEFFRFENGKVVEFWTEADNLSFMQQLGAIPMTQH